MTFNELRATLSLGLVFSLRMLGMFMVLPVLTTSGIKLQEASESLIGLAIGIYGLMQAIFQIPFGLLSDRLGRKPLIIGGLIVFIIGSIIAALSYSIWGIIIGRALQGFSAISAIIMALLSDLTREQNRTKAMAFIGASFGVIFTVAIVIGPIITYTFGLHMLFWITAILAFISIILTIWVVPDNKRYILNRESRILKNCFSKVLTESRLLKLNFSIMCLHILLMFTFIVLPKKLELVNLPIEEHWKIYLVTILISFLLIVPFIVLAETKRCIKYIFLICIILLIITEIIFWNSKTDFWKLVFGVQLFFIAFNLMEALLPSIVSKESPIGYKGTAMGFYSTSQSLGVAIGGLLGGWIDDIFGANMVFLSGASLSIIWFLIAKTIKEPPYISSISIKIPDEIEINDMLKQYLEKLEGINELLIIPQERNLYVKIDTKIISRFKIEQELRNF